MEARVHIAPLFSFPRFLPPVSYNAPFPFLPLSPSDASSAEMNVRAVLLSALLAVLYTVIPAAAGPLAYGICQAGCSVPTVAW